MDYVSVPLKVSAAGMRLAGYMIESNLRMAQAMGEAALRANPLIARPGTMPSDLAVQAAAVKKSAPVKKAKPAAKKAAPVKKAAPAEKKPAPVKQAVADAPKPAEAPARKAAPAAKPAELSKSAGQGMAEPKRPRQPSAPPEMPAPRNSAPKDGVS